MHNILIRYKGIISENDDTFNIGHNPLKVDRVMDPFKLKVCEKSSVWAITK